MRKFLIEMETEITLEELKNNYDRKREQMALEGIDSFARYLDLCMARNNGALTEILTDETPRGEQRNAVTLCRVWYSDDAEDCCDEWLTEQEAHEKQAWGYSVMPQ